MPQLLMSVNSLNQIRFEELIESVQAPLWFDSRQIISGLHVNVGWYAFLLLVYKTFGFSLHTGKVVYLVLAFFSNFALFYLLTRFFKAGVASVILFTIALSPTYLYMNALNLHWALTFHILIVILILLYLLDFKKRGLSLVISGLISLLMIWGWLSYQAFVFYIPSLVIFYWLKYRFHLRGVKAHLGGVRLAVVTATAFLLPLLMLFVWVDNRQILIADPSSGGGLFRGGGSFALSETVFAQAWTDFISDFFIKGVSHHYEVASAEFSYAFPIITLLFIFYAISKASLRVRRIWVKAKSSRLLISLALLVIGFDIFVFSTTSDLGMPGMKRLTPMLVSIYFLWVLVWWTAEKGVIRVIGGIWGIRVILGLLLVHHLIVYPVNLAAIREPSPFTVTDWFDEENPQKSVEMLVKAAQKEDLNLDCRPLIEKFGGCSYDFIYPAVVGSCRWNYLSCYQILGYDSKDNKFVPLSIDFLQSKYFER